VSRFSAAGRRIFAPDCFASTRTHRSPRSESPARRISSGSAITFFQAGKGTPYQTAGTEAHRGLGLSSEGKSLVGLHQPCEFKNVQGKVMKVPTVTGPCRSLHAVGGQKLTFQQWFATLN